jgi:hypothetical protein
MRLSFLSCSTPSQAWLNRLWTSITGGNFGLRNDYYGDTIRMQVLLTVAGDWWRPKNRKLSRQDSGPIARSPASSRASLSANIEEAKR